MNSARDVRIARYRRRRLGANSVSGAPKELRATSAESKLNDYVAIGASAIPSMEASNGPAEKIGHCAGPPFLKHRPEERARLAKSQVHRQDAPGLAPDQVTEVSKSGAMVADRAVETQKEEDMRHPAKVWTDPDFERESLERLRLEFKRNNLMGYGAHGRKLSIPQ